ncbi:MAG: PilZ domain-containing protein [Pseudomonadales bacterium]|nr:PilZ domain-containing protein [Pseudomonadales bacterium]
MAKRTQHPERRRFFRIEDSVYLQLDSDGQEDTVSKPSGAGESGFYLYINEFRKISAESKRHLHLAENTDPHITAYLQALNDKISCLAQAILFSQEEQELEANSSIQLSEGGFSTLLSQPYARGQRLKCKMILYPNNHIMFFSSEVVYCRQEAIPTPEGSQPLYRAGFEFVHLNEGDAQLLARHIINKQANERRKKHSEAQSPEEKQL